jgi:hypothetical protein
MNRFRGTSAKGGEFIVLYECDGMNVHMSDKNIKINKKKNIPPNLYFNVREGLASPLH